MFKLSIRQMTYSALLIVIAIIFSRFISINTPVFNVELGGVPIMAGGILFGPVIGGIIGFLSDLIGHLIRPFGVYHPGFALNETLTGVIPGLIFMLYKRMKKEEPNKNITELFIITIMLIVLDIVGSYYFFNLNKIGDIILDINGRTSLVVLVNLSIVACMGVTYYLHYKYPKQKSVVNIDRLVLTILLVEVLVYIALTPIWLNITYEVPYVSSILIRVARVAFILPIKAIFLYVLLRAANDMKAIQKI